MPSMSVIERTFCRTRAWRIFTTRSVLPWALQGLEPAGDLLELGAGSGRRRLADRPEVRVQQADVTDLPFDDRSFDVVASHLMLHHVIAWDRALAETFRVLRPGGILIGYDLTDSLAARLVHRLDRSPHALIRADAFEPGLLAAGFCDVGVTEGFGGRVVRFRASRPRG